MEKERLNNKKMSIKRDDEKELLVWRRAGLGEEDGGRLAIGRGRLAGPPRGKPFAGIHRGH